MSPDRLDSSGAWVAVGCDKGFVAVFDGQDKAEFEPAEADKVHDGAVTSILFEPEELRFFSTGTDHKLLSTHARGKLEPEDKGRANNHTDAVTALIHLPTGDRLMTGSRDSTVKNWPRAGAVKPAMLTDKQCKNAICPPGKKRARFTDAHGLYMEVSPGGSRRWFWKTYTDGKESRLALGSYPSMGLADARKARDAAKLQKATGVDLVQARKLDKLKG